MSSNTQQKRDEVLDIFCWPAEKLVPIQVCFECPKQERCRSYQSHYLKYENRVARLREEWGAIEPAIEIIIRKKRRKTMPEEKKERATRTKVKQLYYYEFKPGDGGEEIQETGGEEIQEIGDEDRILEIVKSRGQILKIYKLGEEQEVVIKIQKKTPGR